MFPLRHSYVRIIISEEKGIDILRIITGKLRGRKLAVPQDRQVRPTSDKVKEAIFSMIASHIGEGCVCADVFSGTGNLGLEAISRGAARVYFGDKSRDSIRLTRENIKHCGVEEQAVLFAGDYKNTLSRIRETVDVFFLDPPYAENLLIPCMEAISEQELLSPGGVIIAEHDIKDTLPDRIGSLCKIKEKKYGRIGVTLYAEESANE